MKTLALVLATLSFTVACSSKNGANNINLSGARANAAGADDSDPGQVVKSPILRPGIIADPVEEELPSPGTSSAPSKPNSTNAGTSKPVAPHSDAEASARPNASASNDGAPTAQSNLTTPAARPPIKTVRPARASAPIANAPMTSAPIADADVAPNYQGKPVRSARPTCGSAYEAEDADWFPGLPGPKGQPIFTGGFERLLAGARGAESDPSYGLHFTDAARDTLMSEARRLAYARPAQAQSADRELALRVSDVRVVTDLRQTGRVRLSFGYSVDANQRAPVVLDGTFARTGPSGRLTVTLAQSSARLNPQFAARLTCADQNGDCQNTLIELALLDAQGRPARMAYIVHRWGNAQITISDLERFEFSHIGHPGHREVATYLANTANNACLAVLSSPMAAELSSCVREAMNRLCGRATPQSPAATLFGLRTYAVANGRAGFEFRAVDRAGGAVDDSNPRFLISGALAISSRRPMLDRPLTIQGLPGVVRADLINNDGAGNINLLLLYSADGQERSRMNITARFNPTR